MRLMHSELVHLSRDAAPIALINPYTPTHIFEINLGVLEVKDVNRVKHTFQL